MGMLAVTYFVELAIYAFYLSLNITRTSVNHGINNTHMQYRRYTCIIIQCIILVYTVFVHKLLHSF